MLWWWWCQIADKMMKSFLANSGATVFLLLLLSNDVEQNPGTVYILKDSNVAIICQFDELT